MTETIETMTIINNTDNTVPIQDIPEAKVIIKENLVFINNQEYVVEKNVKNALNEKDLENRYTQLLQKYDYIVGDWGYEQLRLKGFYREDNLSVDKEYRIDTLEDYLREYCAFGCAHFVLKLTGAPIPFTPEPSKTKRRPQKKYYDKTQSDTIDVTPFHSKKKAKTFTKNNTKNKSQKNNHQQIVSTESPKKTTKKHSFVIRTKGDR